MAAMLRSGKTLREVGAAFGVSHVTVKNRVDALEGFKMRPRGRAKKILDVKPLVERGLTQAEIAKQLRSSQSAVSRAIAAIGEE